MPLKKILLIDDDEDDNFFHKMVIAKAGVAEQVMVLESATEALEILSQTTEFPELIFLDLNMPRMNGWEFIEILDKENKLKDLFVVILSTSFNNTDIARARQFQIKHLELKPLTRQILQSVIASLK